MQPNFFSVIIPTYNRATPLVEAIRSVLAQDFTDFEIIIIDDGSTDNTKEMIDENFGDCSNITYHWQPNSERGAARNKGAKLAKGSYINFFDSDDLMLPSHLSLAHEFIRANDLPEVFHLNYVVQDPVGMALRFGPKFDSANEKLIEGNFLSCNGVIIRTDVALQFPFHEDRALSAMEDWELWLRLASAYKIYMVPDISTIIVNHEFRSVLQTDKEKLEVRVKTLINRVTSDAKVAQFYRGKLPVFRSSCYTYVALHLALTKNNRRATLYYLMRGIREHYSAIFTRRFLAILKFFF